MSQEVKTNKTNNNTITMVRDTRLELVTSTVSR